MFRTLSFLFAIFFDCAPASLNDESRWLSTALLLLAFQSNFAQLADLFPLLSLNV